MLLKQILKVILYIRLKVLCLVQHILSTAIY